MKAKEVTFQPPFVGTQLHVFFPTSLAIVAAIYTSVGTTIAMN